MRGKDKEQRTPINHQPLGTVRVDASDAIQASASRIIEAWENHLNREAL
jgi:hypothetical protein